MNHDQPNRDAAFPELLAGYADGELNPTEVARVDAWLVDHPQGAEELNGQRRISTIFSRPWPTEWTPTEAQWSGVVRNVAVAIAAPRPLVAPAARVSRSRLLMVLATIAAAAMLAVFLFPRSHESGGADAAAAGFVIATADDVEIMRVLEADVDRLVVGEPPVRRALVLASFEDVDGLQVVRDTDGMMPMVAMQAAVAPMIVAPMASK